MGRLALPRNQHPQRYRRREGVLTYVSAGPASQKIGSSAYLTGLDLISNMTAVTTAGVPAGTWGTTLAGAFAPLQRVTVRKGGTTPIFSLPGYHTDTFTQVWDQDYASSLTANPLVTATTNVPISHLRIPLTVDPISERGAWYTGDTAQDITLAVDFNAATAAFSANAPTWAGSYDVISEKFEAPQPDLSTTEDTGNWLDKISFFNQVQLFKTVTLSNGTTTVDLDTSQDYIRIVLIFYTGALNAIAFLPADGLYTTLTLAVNDVANLWDGISEASMRFEQAITYDRSLPAGTAVFDFMRDQPPRRRDILSTDPDECKRLTLKIVSTSSSNNCDIIVQSVTDNPAAARWVAQARTRAGR